MIMIARGTIFNSILIIISIFYTYFIIFIASINILIIISSILLFIGFFDLNYYLILYY